jgi:MFS family permease
LTSQPPSAGGTADTDTDADAPTDDPTGAAASRLGALTYRDFRLMFLGRIFAWTALHMVMVAIAYQVYDRTGDVMNLAYIGLASFAPAIGFALVTGYVADLFDRRLVIAVCYAVMLAGALLFCALTLMEVEAVWPVFVILAVVGTGRAFYQPASNALVPNLVPVAVFPNAVAWHTSVGKICQVAGPALGGVIYLAGPEVVYAVSAGGFLLGVATIALIRTRTLRGGRPKTTLAVLLAGLRYVYEKKIILGAISLDLFVVLLGGVTALLPVFARDILEVGPSGAGFLRSAMAAGAVLSGLALTQVSMTRAVGHILFVSVAIYGIATVAFGVSTLFWLSMLAMATLGCADMVSVYIRTTLLQIATPDEMRGRVSAVNAVFTGASNELGEFRAGVMAALIGTVPAVLFGGFGAIAVAAVFWKMFPELVRVQRMDRML